MHYDEMTKLIESEFDRIRELRETKGKEYASEEDTLADFREVAREAGVNELQVWLTYVKKHQRAIDTFIREGAVKSEAIEGRIRDVIVYHLLLLGLLKDSSPTTAYPDGTPFGFREEEGILPLKCGAIGAVEQHSSEMATICCELAPDHPGMHYGRTAEHHGYQWAEDGRSVEAVNEAASKAMRAAHVFADPELEGDGRDPGTA